MTQYISYIRISPEGRPGLKSKATSYIPSGLGVDAQRAAINALLKPTDALLAEYSELESGKLKNRPILQEALADCRKRKAVLLIARLDRLARNVAFVSSLMESGIEFIACDMPHANKLTLHIMAAFAEHERDIISKRTKEALAQAKANGVKLGNPRLNEARALAVKANKKGVAPPVAELMTHLRASGKSFAKIAAQLNSSGIKSPRGKRWHAASVKFQMRGGQNENHYPLRLHNACEGSQAAV